MRAVLGPFHPHLENAFVEEVRKYKASDPLLPLLVLVPSDSLRRRLKVALAAGGRLNLLNVYLLTFHQLYLRLFEEACGAIPTGLADDLVLEEALGHFIRAGHASTLPFASVEEKAGGCGALWQTLRDLKDGGVEPANVLSALRENLFDQRDAPNTKLLIELFESFAGRCREWPLYDYADFVATVQETAPSSAFLSSFRRIFYYGFYDLTQVQMDFFREVARSHDPALFFPLMRGHPAWSFAERFYERHVQGLVTEESLLCRPSMDACSLPLFDERTESRAAATPIAICCSVVSCSGPRDEVATVAKEALRLGRDAGLAFSEIGVVARSLEPYAGWITEVFRDHRIPIATSAEEPLLQSNLAKAAMLLLNLAAKDYLRNYFVDLVSSPHFNLRAVCPDGVIPRPDLWEVLTRKLGITKGAEEWLRLKNYLDKDLKISEGSDDDGEDKPVRIAAEQVGLLWSLFSELQGDLSRLPAEASWNDYVTAWKKLLKKYLDLDEAEAVTADSPNELARNKILETLTALSTLDAVSAKTSLTRFVLTFQSWLERASIRVADRNIDGVAVLDAMAARGSRFRALFVLGMNEGLFPRTIREDAFLRDRPRRVMETVLGYKVSEKLAAFDEEKLLFAMLAGAAGEYFCCLWHRADETGRALEPSWYLAELERVFPDPPGVTRRTIPRSIRDKKNAEPFRDADLLVPEELAIRLSLEGEDVEPLLKHLPKTASLYGRGTKMIETIEDAYSGLSIYDGITGHLEDYWQRLSAEGAAPTALERYARCPFQFFACNVLGLRRLERPEEQFSISPSDQGKLVHTILKSFFQGLMDRGYFAADGRPLEAREFLETAATKAFLAYQAENPVGYPLAWEILQEEILELLRQGVAQDLQELSASGRRPVALEIDLRGKLPAGWPAPASSLALRGTLDRIDLEPAAGRYRVIDYKYKTGSKPDKFDNNLALGALQAQKLQPPIYVLLAREYAARKKQTAGAIEVAFYFFARRWDQGPFSQAVFSAEDWQGESGESLKETLALLIRGIYQGLFFIDPGEACRTCEVSHVCRKEHLPTAWRAANDPLTEPHAGLAEKRASKEGKG